MILVVYTTLYREGGPQFAQAAQTLVQAKKQEFPDAELRSVAVESKQEFRESLDAIADEGKSISELHFIGHSGVYGIMFGTREWPEQFSPHEWRGLNIPFAPKAQAYFHACRTSRWFAPFFARTFGVTAHGYYWYTCFSRSADRFVWRGLKGLDSTAPLYVISMKGKKSHGPIGTVQKYSGAALPEPMLAFTPSESEPDTGYDRVAQLYDEAFADITVREDEWKWLQEHIQQNSALRVLDIGCGNGSLLAELAPHITSGIGLDASQEMIRQARTRFAHQKNLCFEHVSGPVLPFEDGSFDLVISFMSFRYLDWDPIMAQIRRTLAPGGRILIVDMAASPVRGKDIPQFIRSKIRHHIQRRKHPGFYQKLNALVNNPGWEQMLRYNPVRAEHEYRWYFSSRFPDGTIDTLNVGWTHRLLAFDSGPLEPGTTPPQTWP